ncbi:hypothetical protein GCM10009558_055470 [Virgisporangium aurantiacum]
MDSRRPKPLQDGHFRGLAVRHVSDGYLSGRPFSDPPSNSKSRGDRQCTQRNVGATVSDGRRVPYPPSRPHVFTFHHRPADGAPAGRDQQLVSNPGTRYPDNPEGDSERFQ